MKKTFITLLFISLLHVSAYAASISITPLPTPGNGVMAYRVTLDSEGTALNALSGVISFPTDLFELQSLDTTSSIVSYWMQQPSVSKEKTLNQRTQVVFEGIMPGGFTGVRSATYEGEHPGKVFDLLFVPKVPGEAILAFDSIKVLAHDGNGTTISTKTQDIHVILDQGIKISPTSKPVRVYHVGMNVLVTQQKDVARKAWYLVTTFESTQKTVKTLSVAESTHSQADKLAAYEWKTIDGPYVLLHQNRNRFVHVRADYYDNTYEVITISPVENSGRNIAESCILITITILLLGSGLRSYYVAYLKKKKRIH